MLFHQLNYGFVSLSTFHLWDVIEGFGSHRFWWWSNTSCLPFVGSDFRCTSSSCCFCLRYSKFVLFLSWKSTDILTLIINRNLCSTIMSSSLSSNLHTTSIIFLWFGFLIHFFYKNIDIITHSFQILSQQFIFSPQKLFLFIML